MDNTPKKTTFLEQMANGLTSWVGSPSSFLIHTVFFIIILILPGFGVNTEKVLLILTTLVSLEAIYLSIFIQYSVNKSASKLHEVAEDIEDVTEDVEEISADVEDISENLEELQEGIEAEDEKISYEKLEKQAENLLSELRSLKNKTKD